MAALLLGTISACQAVEQPVGMTMLFLNKGNFAIGVKRFDPDGQRGPVPGYLGAEPNDNRNQGGAQMSFMPGDSKRGMPQFVEVEWFQETAESKALQESVQQPQGTVTKQLWDDYLRKLEEVRERGFTYRKRIDLTPILTSVLIAQARNNPKTTNIKLVVIFKDDQVSIEAMPEKWR